MNADNPTLLDYSLDTMPDPLQASPLHGDVQYGTLSFVVSNGGRSPVILSKVRITLPVGDLAQDLCRDAGGILWSVSPTGVWDVTMTTPGVFLLVPHSGTPVTVTIDGMVIQLHNIPVNKQVGTVAVAVDETATTGTAPAQVRRRTFSVAKFPYGFFFSDFTAQVPMVHDGGSVVLTWKGSDIATYALSWNLGPATNVTDVRSWSSPPLKTDTTFLLRATATFEGETVTADLSTTVIVADPELQASTLQVTGISNLQGAATLANATVTGSLTVSGSTNLNGTISLAGNAAAGSLTVHDSLISSGSATFNAATFNGNINLNGVLVGNSWIGGNAGRVQGYGTAGTAVFAFKYDQANFGNTPTAIQIWCDTTGVFKTFVIDHPLDPEMYLVHATLEGPEGAVFYRGSAQLDQGAAVIALPAYFEAFTDPASVTILLTAIDGFDPLAVMTEGGRKVHGGAFRVYSSVPGSTQKFDWEVKATRSDQPALIVERHRAHVTRRGDGPYTYVVPSWSRPRVDPATAPFAH